ncbi:alpha/beta hydrolase family protein [Acidicapsa acidisoli]|uniref:alpha/beta hydrolase family protein n=1 Tax=Acidicapsa acidisoli TaxID=1615681 RepID=UPI0021E0BCA9|nr:alpha/beta hydrolase [Acidicapsa acidisoli]
MLDNASYRIDMPEKWNGILIVYYHGYSEKPVVFDKDKPNEISSLFAYAGYAVIQSGYSEIGLAIEHAVPETEALRRYAIAKYGQPKETYVTGHSMGGELTMITMESYPNRYDGALPLCGLLEPTTWAIGRASAMRAAFDYYYPGLLPGPIGIPATVELNDALADKVLKALPGNPTGLTEMMALNGFKTKEDLAWGVVFATYIQRDLEEKIGASAMDNRNFIYTGGPDDNALNDGVKRYTASDAALGYLKSWYTPTGILLKPTLAVHTTYDPIIPADSVRLYADLVQRNRSADNFVQQYVKADGHCHFSDVETMTALDELIQWNHSGVRPDGGVVPVKAK